MRSLISQGWPADLIGHLPTRCGAGAGEWLALLDGGLAENEAGRFRLTDEGRRTYKRQKQGRYF
jgi:hypothetical protein